VISQILAGLSAVALAAAGGCGPETGKKPAQDATKPVISSANGEHRITERLHRKVRTKGEISKPCKVWILWDIPNGKRGYDAVELGVKSYGKGAEITLDLGKKYDFNYTDPETRRKVYKKRTRATTLVTSGCPEWYKA
jgi:hypothetical protein